MQNINYSERIKSLRKSKGLTQQQLADQTGLSLRTIQRVEKGTEEISGYSLNQISKVLDIPLEQIIMQNVDQISIDNNQTGSVKILYISSLLFILFPLLGFIVPAIIGFTKENRNAFYRKHLRFILLLQGIQSLIIFLLLFVITPIILLIPTSTQPQKVKIDYVSTPEVKQNKEYVSILRKDSIYILKNLQNISPIKIKDIHNKRLISSTKDSITFHESQYNSIIAILGIKDNNSAKEVQIDENPIESKINWFTVIVTALIILYYVINIGIVIYRLSKINKTDNAIIDQL